MIIRQQKSAAEQSSGLHRLRLRACVAAIALGAFLTPAIAASLDDYKLGPLDKVRLRVQEWRASKDEVYEWSTLKEDYIVGPSGTVSIPLAGDIRASGLTTRELGSAIGAKLKERLGMIEAPDTAVEIVQYRPFYIVGQVDKPGEYPYRPGITVLQAISVAGGMQRINDMGLFRLNRDSIGSRGDLAITIAQTRNMLARKARLQAELNSATDITFPKELTDHASESSVKMLLEQERTIFETRRRALETQISALEHLKSYLNKEVESLTAQVQTETTQMDLVNKELSSISSLVERGLSSAPRQLLLQRTIAQIEGERLRLQTSVVKAQQDISKTDIEIVDARNKYNNEVTVELRATQAALEELKDKADTTAKLIYESEVTAPQFIHDRMNSQKMQPILKIVRETNGTSSELYVGETTEVLPGDTIKVEMPIRDDQTLNFSSKATGMEGKESTISSTQ
jgi:polysaccharide export outer membrane protein/exopolysaccharide production protein ExoF